MHASFGKLMNIKWKMEIQMNILSDRNVFKQNKNRVFQQFFCFLLIVLVAEIATGVYAFMNQDQLMKMVRDTVKHSVREQYSDIQSQTLAFDTFQKNVCKTDLDKIIHKKVELKIKSIIYLICFI